MRHERFLEPVSEAEPCGPDLDELDDPDFRNYVGEVEGSIPASFFNRPDHAEAEAVDLDSEVAAIEGLLERSRHLRLLVLEARLQAFFGTLEGFADVVDTMAGLVERYWDEVHPRGEDGDFTRRANLVRSLEDVRQIVIPLQHRVLARDRRVGPVTMRRELVASGAVQPRPGEEKGDSGTIRMRLKEEENFAALKESHAAARTAGEALDRLRAAFIDRSGYEYAPSFDALGAFLKKTAVFLEEVRPDLVEAGTDPEAEPEAGQEEEDAAPAESGGAAAPARSVSGIGSRAAAAAALAAAEGYFLRNEPSAPALILVHQARRLMGRPLVETIAALLPATADKTSITFNGHPSLRLSMADMRSITESAFAAAGAEPAEEAPLPAALTRREAASLLAGVEMFLREAEPASAVPILLRRAQEWLGKDFSALIGEIVPEK